MNAIRKNLGSILFAAAGLTLATVLAPLPACAADAETNYKKYCRACHGEEGRGNGPGAKALKTPPGNFTTCDTPESRDREWLIKIIGEGGAAVGRSAQMVGLGKRLSADEVGALADYVAAFCNSE